jgi:hypothetical protein
MRLQDIIHETWNFVGCSLNALVDAANTELTWASDVSGCRLKETPKHPLAEDLPLHAVEPNHSVSHSQPRKRTEDSTDNDESKRQRSDKNSTTQRELPLEDTVKICNERKTSSNNSMGNAQVCDLQEPDKDDKKQVKVVLKGRTRHKAKELLQKVDKNAQVRAQVAKLTSPTTKVVNLASQADESRLNSDKRLQSTVSSSLDILRKGLMMRKPHPHDPNESNMVDTTTRIIDSSGNSLSSINTSFVRSSNTEIPVVDLESKVSV